jgi:D-sedoheptulose 7-phosphate isomerase
MDFYQNYSKSLYEQLELIDKALVEELVQDLYLAWQHGKQVFICGNGGSAGNAVHVANDLLYGVNPEGKAVKVEALTANTAVLTCLANDTGYDNIFAQQLITKAEKGDILIAMSGSGNSPNIVKAIQQGNDLSMKTYAIVGFEGGESKAVAHVTIHSPIKDMQISEDIQIIIGHWIMRRLYQLVHNTEN